MIILACDPKEQGVEEQLGVPSFSGITLSHEHIMSNFGGEPAYEPNYDTTALFEQVIPYLRKVKSLGVDRIYDCTTAYFGRSINLLQQISDSTGIEIVTNSGWYAAANDRYVPPQAYDSTIEDIAAIWIDEFENGIDQTSIKPGFIKLAFDNNVSAIDVKLFEAGLVTHLKTGLTLAVHTGDNESGVAAQLNLMEQYGVHPSAWIWTHAHKSNDLALLLEVAKKGAWISLDGVRLEAFTPAGSSKEELDKYINYLDTFKDEGLLNQVLLSHDGNSFPRGGAIRPYDAIMTTLIPQLLEHGFNEKEIEQLMKVNPTNAFEVRVREELE